MASAHYVRGPAAFDLAVDDQKRRFGLLILQSSDHFMENHAIFATPVVTDIPPVVYECLIVAWTGNCCCLHSPGQTA